MAGVCKVILIGNLGRDPETRYTPNGAMNVQFSMAVSRRWTDQSGQQQEKTNWFRVTAWTRLAETLDQLTQNGYLAKGRQVYVSGTLDTREYQDQSGQTRTSLEVRADEVVLLGSRGDGEGGAAGMGASGGRGGSRSGGEDEGFGSRDFDEVPF
jgi:single-strand DNA-binding protein